MKILKVWRLNIFRKINKYESIITKNCLKRFHKQMLFPPV